MVRENSSEGKPFNSVAEEAVLGSILVNPDMYEEMASQLEPTSFFIDCNRWILEEFISLRRQNLPIDVLTVSRD